MTADVELLPLPNVWKYDGSGKLIGQFTADTMEAYARANVEHHTAALRAEVERWKVPCLEWLDKTEWVQQTVKPRELGHHRADIVRERIQRSESRAERLAEALRECVENREGLAYESELLARIDALLREQETTNG